MGAGEPIIIEVTEGITVRLCSPTSAILMFRAKNETVQLSLCFLTDVVTLNSSPKHQTPSSPPSETSLPQVIQEADTHTEDEEDASQCHGNRMETECISYLLSNQAKEDSEDPHHGYVGPCPVRELRRLRRRVRRVLESWLQHYRAVTGICQPDIKRRLEPVCHHLSHIDSVPLPAVGISGQRQRDLAQCDSESGYEQTIRHSHATVRCLVPSSSKPQCLTALLKSPKEEAQHITDTGIIRVHSNIKLESILVPWLPATWHPSPLPRDPFGSTCPCPAALRAALRGDEGWQGRRCHCRRIPTLTDVEYDAFVAGQGARSEQVQVICITGLQREGLAASSRHEELLEQLYRRMNRRRSTPCSQCHTDSYRLLKYEVPSPEWRGIPQNTLLQRRHNVAPGMFLLYLRGRLLLASYIFTDDSSCSVSDIQKHVSQARRHYRLSQFLPPHFKIRGAGLCCSRCVCEPVLLSPLIPPSAQENTYGL
ncbi:uncharacterized protein LOC134446649 isoform X2 [Engraulis encrasicolus]|uniref:uncharacterized protein LOC134446649 isoform X2 n=1 Tax=Engraulis encrasicolus TaxID=184585 RepID=UPI002FD74776